MTNRHEANVPEELADWVEHRIRIALAAKPVRGTTASLLKTETRSEMADHQLRPNELAIIAKRLIASLGDAK